jgi:hypothetical protein
MTTVWAARDNTGIWVDRSKAGDWQYVITFSTLGDLIGQLESLRPSPMGQVRKLAIVAHGDKNGVVQLERNLTADTAMSFKSEFLALSRFMVDFGRLIFFSCIAGGDDPGTQLLNTLSAQCLPGRHVIGFEKFGSIGRYGSENAPGAIFAAQSPPPSPLDLIVADSTQGKRLSEYSWYSKWSFNGRIIRRPLGDQSAPTKVSRVSFGVQSAQGAIRSHRLEINYVAIDKDRARTPPLRHVVDAFTASGIDVAHKLKYLPRGELDQLAGTRQNEGAVVVWTQDIRLRKCADPRCPGHSEPWHFCTEFVKAIPNGPLSWP